MSEDKLAKTPDGRKDKKKEKKKRRNPVIKWLREMKSELKKVVWPTPKQTLNNTAVALVIMLASSIVVWCVDQAGAQIVQALLTLGGK
ncbi:preprotein translocase subunit SecE [Oscillospiraceae bacterium CM]|nr:preprotein translocase subunit SecE [Oscillospiraceae bacterium CM]